MCRAYLSAVSTLFALLGISRTIQLPAHLQLIGKSADGRWVKARQTRRDVGP